MKIKGLQHMHTQTMAHTVHAHSNSDSHKLCHVIFVAGMVMFDHGIPPCQVIAAMPILCDPALCETAYFVPVATHRACAFLRVSEVPGTLMLLIGEDTWQVLEARFDQEWMNCRMCSVLPRQSFLYFVSSVDLLGLSAFVLPFL